MHDPFVLLDQDRDRWFKKDNMPRVTDGNEVKALIRGKETYQDMAECMLDAAKPQPENAARKPAFIYVLGWDLNGASYFEMPLLAYDAKSTPSEIFRKAAAAQAEVRVMAWANGPETPFGTPSTVYAIDDINKLSTGRGVVDWKTAIWWDPPVNLGALNYRFHNGAHHQKVVVTNGSLGLTAFLGGIDLEVKRLDMPKVDEKDQGWQGWQDVHCRIRGPAADDVLAVFSQRWNDYFNGKDDDVNHDSHPPKLNGVPVKNLRTGLIGSAVRSRPVDDEPYRQSVQICRTFHSKLYDLIPPGGRAGEKTIREMIKHAIGQAEHFIYMEDQYLFSMEIAEALKGAIAKPSFRWLIVLIPADEEVDREVVQAPYRRSEFIKLLRAAPGGEKLKIFVSTRYVHSKIYVIDDKFAVIGSANCNRRGMQHDSEIAAAIFDRSSNREEALHFARRLRMRLWATHLNLSGQSNDPNIPTNDEDEFAELADGIASASHWVNIWNYVKRPSSPRVRPYQERENYDFNLAIQGLEKTKADKRDEVKKEVKKKFEGPYGFALSVAVKAELDRRFPSNRHGVEKAWDELYDPGDI
jgi:phosphatidylserine/phosphatidylglycerophosphate/cardiolipin synthase-like enzyme